MKTLPIVHRDVPRHVRDRFVSKIAIGNPVDCWEWQASRSRQGYGRFQMRQPHGCVGAHRVSYALFVGDLQEGMTVDHLCRNRSCVNPFHLEAVPLAENVMRGNGICAQHARKTRCPRGHAYSTKRRYDGKTQRYCAECGRAYQRDWARNKFGVRPEAYRV